MQVIKHTSKESIFETHKTSSGVQKRGISDPKERPPNYLKKRRKSDNLPR